MLDWNSLIDDRTKISDLLVVPNVEVSSIKHYKRENFKVNTEQLEQYPGIFKYNPIPKRFGHK